MSRAFAAAALAAVQGIVLGCVPDLLPDGPAGMRQASPADAVAAVDFDRVRCFSQARFDELAEQSLAGSCVALRRVAWELVWASAALWVKESCTSLPQSAYVDRVAVYLETLLYWCESLAEESAEPSGDLSSIASTATNESIFLSCFEDVLQLSTLGSCANILEYFFDNLPRLIPVCLDTLPRKRQLINITSSLLKRTNASLYPSVVSLLLRISSNVFNANDKSVLNVKCATNPNSELRLEEVNDQNDMDVLYKLLWGLQKQLLDPKRYVMESDRPLLACVLNDMEAVVVKFCEIAASQSENLKSSRKDKPLVPQKNSFINSKFLTSREIFEAQISDPYFRRQFLVEFLLFLRILAYFSNSNVEKLLDELSKDKASKRNTNLLPASKCEWLSEEEVFKIKGLQAKICFVLSRIPPFGNEFVELALRMIRDEHIWMSWKMRYCKPDIIRHIDSLVLPSSRINLRFGVDDFKREFCSSRLNNMRIACSEAQVPLKSQFSIPDLESWTSQVEYEVNGEIESEYQLSKKEQWKWQTVRFFISKSFSSLSKPATENFISDISNRLRGLPERIFHEDIKELDKPPMDDNNIQIEASSSKDVPGKIELDKVAQKVETEAIATSFLGVSSNTTADFKASQKTEIFEVLKGLENAVHDKESAFEAPQSISKTAKVSGTPAKHLVSRLGNTESKSSPEKQDGSRRSHSQSHGKPDKTRDYPAAVLASESSGLHSSSSSKNRDAGLSGRHLESSSSSSRHSSRKSDRGETSKSSESFQNLPEREASRTLTQGSRSLIRSLVENSANSALASGSGSASGSTLTSSGNGLNALSNFEIRLGNSGHQKRENSGNTSSRSYRKVSTPLPSSSSSESKSTDKYRESRKSASSADTGAQNSTASESSTLMRLSSNELSTLKAAVRSRKSKTEGRNEFERNSGIILTSSSSSSSSRNGENFANMGTNLSSSSAGTPSSSSSSTGYSGKSNHGSSAHTQNTFNSTSSTATVFQARDRKRNRDSSVGVSRSGNSIGAGSTGVIEYMGNRSSSEGFSSQNIGSMRSQVHSGAGAPLPTKLAGDRSRSSREPENYSASDSRSQGQSLSLSSSSGGRESRRSTKTDVTINIESSVRERSSVGSSGGGGGRGFGFGSNGQSSRRSHETESYLITGTAMDRGPPRESGGVSPESIRDSRKKKSRKS